VALPRQKPRVAFVDGPYGGWQGDFACFDTVVLIAGSTGVTFTLPLLLDLARRAARQQQTKPLLPVRRVEFVWVVRNVDHVSWVSEELQSAFTTLRQQAGIDVAVRIFVTRDDGLADVLPQTPPEGRLDHKTATASSTEPTTKLPDDGTKGDVPGREATTATRSLGHSVPVLPSGASDTGDISEWASVEPGRPAFGPMMADIVARADGETGVAVCGPLGLSTAVRSTVAGLLSRKGPAKQGIYLHVEGFSW
jgi:hypothetical protein